MLLNQLTPLPSHELTLRTVGDRLVERGHTVTQVSLVDPQLNRIFIYMSTASTIRILSLLLCRCGMPKLIHTMISKLTSVSSPSGPRYILHAIYNKFQRLLSRIDDSRYPCHFHNFTFTISLSQFHFHTFTFTFTPCIGCVRGFPRG